jgi:hypothetical protein
MTPAPHASFNRFSRTPLLIGLAMMCGLASTASGQEQQPSKPVIPVPVASSVDRPQRIGLPPKKMSGRNSMSRRWLNPTPADIKLFLLVAGDIKPDWRESLTALQKDDPEAFTRAVMTNGRRLWQLVALREQKPALYDLRIEEIRVREILRSLGQQYHAAVAKGSNELVPVLLFQINETATKQIDIQMRVRGEELAAMAEALEQLRSELLIVATDRITRAQQLVDLIIESPLECEPGSQLQPSAEESPEKSGQTGPSGAGDKSSVSDPAESPLG